jgi:ribosome-binding factor A
MKEFNRTQRVGKQIRRDLASIIPREISGPRLGMVSVSGVDVSSDLKYARVYITVFGGDVEQVILHLNKVAGRLRYRLAQHSTTRTTPSLKFVHDGSIEYGSNLSALIDSLATDHSNNSNG